MDDKTAAEIRAALDAATQGKWIAPGSTGVLGAGVVSAPEGRVIALRCASDADAELIANAPDWLRDLLAERERLQAIVEVSTEFVENKATWDMFLIIALNHLDDAMLSNGKPIDVGAIAMQADAILKAIDKWREGEG